MIEIEYNGGNYSFRHDDRNWGEKGLTAHLIGNEHKRETIAVAISYKYIDAYNYGSDVIAKEFDAIFNEKEMPVNIRGNLK